MSDFRYFFEISYYLPFKVVDMKLTKEEIERMTELDRNKNYIRCDGWNVD